MTGIYKISSIKNPKHFYIGSAVDTQKRKWRHFWELSRNLHSNSKMQRHYNKYGREDLIFDIIAECRQEELITTEQYYIDTLFPYFNICKNAGNNIGTKHSRESIEITRLKNKGQKRTEEAKQKMREAKLGKSNLSCKGKPRSEETKMKLRMALLGREGVTKGMVSPFKGVKNRYSQETIDKMRASALLRVKREREIEITLKQDTDNLVDSSE